jgi:hypothetical protein
MDTVTTSIQSTFVIPQGCDYIKVLLNLANQFQ